MYYCCYCCCDHMCEMMSYCHIESNTHGESVTLQDSPGPKALLVFAATTGCVSVTVASRKVQVVQTYAY